MNDIVERLKTTRLLSQRNQMALQTDAAAEILQLRKEVAAYRLLAVNEGWKHVMVEAYGHREYLRQRIEEVDRIAAGTVASGYDAAGYLSAALPSHQGDE